MLSSTAYRILKQGGELETWSWFDPLTTVSSNFSVPSAYRAPSRHLEPPFSVGEVGRLNPYHGEDLPMRFTARPRVGGRRAAGRIFGCVSRPAPGWGGVAP